MTDFPSTIRLLAALLGAGLLGACGTDPSTDAPSAGASATLDAHVFQDHWQGGGGTLLIRSLDGETVWRNRAEVEPGRHEVLFEYEVTTACAPETGCAVRRYHDRIAFDAEAERRYRLHANVGDDGMLRAEIVDLTSGDPVGTVETRKAVVEHEGYPNQAWRGLCEDADMGDATARRAIGLHYWRGWWPAQRNVILAYQWLTLAAQANDSAAPSFRDTLAAEMSPEEIEEAEGRIANWKPGNCTVEAKLK